MLDLVVKERKKERKRHRLIAVASTATTQLNKVEPKAYNCKSNSVPRTIAREMSSCVDLSDGTVLTWYLVWRNKQALELTCVI